LSPLRFEYSSTLEGHALGIFPIPAPNQYGILGQVLKVLALAWHSSTVTGIFNQKIFGIRRKRLSYI
jgi:hypothetical protein